MRKLLLALMLLPSLCFGQLSIPYIKASYGYNFKNDKSASNFAAEYTYLKDIASYYSAMYFGFNTGVNLNNGRVQIPLQYVVMENEWRDAVKVGVILDKEINKTDLFFAFGFDNQIVRRRTDGFIYTIETYVKYNKYRIEAGGRLGVGFIYDKYHYKKWYKNY